METYRVTGPSVHVVHHSGEDETANSHEREVVEAGATIEMDPDRAKHLVKKGALERIGENDESGASSEAAADTTEDTDESADADTSDDAAESEAESDEDDLDPEQPPEHLTEAWLEAADYRGLQRAAGRFDDVNGNWGEDRLRAELLDTVENEG